MKANGPMRRARRLTADRRGAVAVMFALLMIPVIGFVALAVDVGAAVWAREQLDLAADAAALSAVTTGANDYAANAATSFTHAQQAGLKRFNAQADRMPNVTLTSIGVAVTHSGGKVTANVSYTAAYRTWFGGIVGMPSLPADGNTVAARTVSPFFNISILMDDSSSMAIGATQADMARLGQLVRASPLFAAWGQNQNCAFGCHFAADNNDFYGLAHSNGVQLRIDMLIGAVASVIQTISGFANAAQFQVGLYTFNAGFSTLYPASANLAGALAAARAMTVPVTTAGNDADTNIPLALQSISAALPASGDGSTAQSPQRFLFIVTDGVADYYDAGNNRVIAPINPAQCAALKAKGVQIMTLYTQYIPLVPPEVPTANAFYVSNVSPFQAQLWPNLQSCASSPDYAFQASDPASINAALQAMLQAALSTPARFTQ